MAIDYGERRLGLAISDPLKIIAKPFKIIDRAHKHNYIKEILSIIVEEDIELLVIGLPLTLKGTYSKQTNAVKEFISILKAKIQIPVLHIDERLSSVAAKKSLREQNIDIRGNKEKIDETAAAIILQEFLDSN